ARAPVAPVERVALAHAQRRAEALRAAEPHEQHQAAPPGREQALPGRARQVLAAGAVQGAGPAVEGVHRLEVRLLERVARAHLEPDPLLLGAPHLAPGAYPVLGAEAGQERLLVGVAGVAP